MEQISNCTSQAVQKSLYLERFWHKAAENFKRKFKIKVILQTVMKLIISVLTFFICYLSLFQIANTSHPV
jgi:hypothetical protein